MSHGFARISTDKPCIGDVDSERMASSSSNLKHSDLTDKIIGVFYDVYNDLGHGFLESTYAEAMVVALDSSGLALNFGIRPQFRRLLFDNERKQIRENPCQSVAKVSE